LNDFPIPFYFAAFLIHLELFFIFNIFPKHFLNRFVCFLKIQQKRNIFLKKALEKQHIRRGKKQKQLEKKTRMSATKNSVGVQKNCFFTITKGGLQKKKARFHSLLL